MNHVHASAITALITFAMVLIIGFFWRLLSMRWADRPAGKAMAFLY